MTTTRSMHKKALHDEALFKQPPPREDCPICFIRLPSLVSGSSYQVCCGKFICNGCIYAVDTLDEREFICPLCRSNSDDDTYRDKEKQRVEAGDCNAINRLGFSYYEGSNGLEQNHKKAIELWHQAGKLGCALSYYNIGNAYMDGIGVAGIDMDKARHYWELGAIGGDDSSRHNLGVYEFEKGNINRAMKHFIIAVKMGYKKSLYAIRESFFYGEMLAVDYERSLQSYQDYIDEIKSDQRDEAAAANEEDKYYEPSD